PRRTEPTRLPGVKKSPAVTDSRAPERVLRELQAVGRIDAHRPGNRIVIPRLLVVLEETTVFEIVDVVSEPGQPHRELQVVPGQAAQRHPDDISHDDDPEAARG